METDEGAEFVFREVAAGGSDRVLARIRSSGLVDLTVSSICFLNEQSRCISDNRSSSFSLCAGSPRTLVECEPLDMIGTLLSGATQTFTVFYSPPANQTTPQEAKVLIANNSIENPGYTLTFRGFPCERNEASPICGGCGDGIVNGAEECDDGNLSMEDSCLNACIKATCGDGVLNRSVEMCDDGNEDDQDGCTQNCELALCGDGIQRLDLSPEEEGYEACDDGNLDNEDDCTDTCSIPIAFPGCADTCMNWSQTLRGIQYSPTWTGSTDLCEAGELDEASVLNTVTLLNLFRGLIYESPIMADQQNHQALQECALMMDANGLVDTQPEADWLCYSETGSSAVSQSLTLDQSAPEAILTHLIDANDPLQLSHRRRLLSPRLQSLGVGSTQSYSCVQAVDEDRPLRYTDWSAFPRACFPISAMVDAAGHHLDDIGWTVNLPPDSAIDGDATVVVTRHSYESLSDPNGPEREPMEVDVHYLEANGESAALHIKPRGWRTEEGFIYEVNISQMTLTQQGSIIYNLIPINCP